jgi:hypothetical protein
MNRAGQMATHGRKEFRKSARSKSGTSGWIRLAQGFATRPCTIVDRSETGVQISVDTPQSVPANFSLLQSRTVGTGKRCRVKWRRGSRIGAEFL